jgi:hypothetical protein
MIEGIEVLFETSQDVSYLEVGQDNSARLFFQIGDDCAVTLSVEDEQRLLVLLLQRNLAVPAGHTLELMQ